MKWLPVYFEQTAPVYRWHVPDLSFGLRLGNSASIPEDPPRLLFEVMDEADEAEERPRWPPFWKSGGDRPWNSIWEGSPSIPLLKLASRSRGKLSGIKPGKNDIRMILKSKSRVFRGFYNSNYKQVKNEWNSSFYRNKTSLRLLSIEND